MRKIAVIAMFAIVAAMVPMTTAGSQPIPGTLDGVGTLMVINSLPTNVNLVIEIDDGGEVIVLTLTSPDQQEVQVPIGARRFRLCSAPPAGGTDLSCTGGAAVGAIGNVTVHSNDIINFIASGSPFGPTSLVYAEQNDTEETETDSAKLTLFNVAGVVPIDICVGDEHVISSPAGSQNMQLAEFDSKDGETRVVKFFIPGAGAATDCNAAPASSTDLGFPSGSNTVINIDALNPACQNDCGYQIFPGEEPDTGNNLDAFCAVVLEAANITPWLQDLFAEVEVGDPDTYPSPEKVEKVITRIAELLEKGNETAPPDIRDAWFTATAAFVQTGRLAAIDYDLEALPQDDLRTLVESIDTPAEDDHEVAAAVEQLSAWVPVNCFGAVETEPSFTG